MCIPTHSGDGTEGKERGPKKGSLATDLGFLLGLNFWLDNVTDSLDNNEWAPASRRQFMEGFQPGNRSLTLSLGYFDLIFNGQ